MVHQKAQALLRITLADLFAAGEILPGRPYEPSGLVAGIDREVAEGSPCDLCGARCRYAGFRTEWGTWRAFAVCVACQHAQEF